MQFILYNASCEVQYEYHITMYYLLQCHTKLSHRLEVIKHACTAVRSFPIALTIIFHRRHEYKGIRYV